MKNQETPFEKWKATNKNILMITDSRQIFKWLINTSGNVLESNPRLIFHSNLHYYLYFCYIKVLPPTRHIKPNQRFDAKPKASPHVPFHTTILHYIKADWDSFQSYMAEAYLSTFFKHAAFKIATLFLEWIRIHSENGILERRTLQP